MVDPLAFAREGRRWQHVLPLSRFPRLAAEAIEGAGELKVSVVGWVGRDGHLFLGLEAVGEIAVGCQRCMDPMVWPFRVENRLMLIPEGRPFPEDELDDDSYDAIEVAARLDLAELVEEEVLLAMPISPRHESCEAPAESEGASRASPFASLAKLRGHSGQD
ncbi:MAG: DUF177 domain-containing protein [Zoogloeaceae bacterium]|nr:DUF177 domain-containing protein [Zoogloeaceae bacterium]